MKSSFEEMYMISDAALRTFISTNKLNEDMTSRLFDALYSSDFEKFNSGLVTTYVSQLKESDFTCMHSVRVAWMSTILAKWARLSMEDCKVIMVLGLLHDVGKIGMPEAILNKPQRLTQKEFDLIKHHPLFGSLWLKASDQISDRLINIVSSHHERPNGKGYPNGTFEESALTRILTVSDIFEAMSGERPYKKTFDYTETLSEMQVMADNNDIDSKVFTVLDRNIRRVMESGKSDPDQ